MFTTPNSESWLLKNNVMSDVPNIRETLQTFHITAHSGSALSSDNETEKYSFHFPLHHVSTLINFIVKHNVVTFLNTNYIKHFYPCFVLANMDKLTSVIAKC